MLIIPIAPITKKNSQRIVKGKNGRPMIIPSKAYKEYEKAALYYLKPYGIDYSVNVRCVFYMPTNRRVDLTNLLEAVDDVMVKAGTLRDDNCLIVAGHDGSRVYVDKEYPRTEIFFEEIE